MITDKSNRPMYRPIMYNKKKKKENVLHYYILQPNQLTAPTAPSVRLNCMADRPSSCSESTEIPARDQPPPTASSSSAFQRLHTQTLNCRSFGMVLTLTIKVIGSVAYTVLQASHAIGVFLICPRKVQELVVRERCL